MARSRPQPNNNQLPPLSSLYPSSSAASRDPKMHPAAFFSPFPNTSSATPNTAAPAAPSPFNPFSTTGTQHSPPQSQQRVVQRDEDASIRAVQGHQVQQWQAEIPGYFAHLGPDHNLSAAGTPLRAGGSQRPGSGPGTGGEERMEEGTARGKKEESVAGDRDGGASVSGEKESKKRKRNRMALSCSECKRRKIKCDRKIPCEACIRRGESATCHWEDKSVDPSPQPFALAYDVEHLLRRLYHLELAVSRLPPDLLPANWSPMPPPTHEAPGEMNEPPPVGSVIAGVTPPPMVPVRPMPLRTAEHARTRIEGGRGEAGKRPGGLGGTQATTSDLDSEDEDAALVLEELALGKSRGLHPGPPMQQEHPQVGTATPPSAATIVEGHDRRVSAGSIVNAVSRQTSAHHHPHHHHHHPAATRTDLPGLSISTSPSAPITTAPSPPKPSFDSHPTCALAPGLDAPPKGTLASDPGKWGAALASLASSPNAVSSVSLGSLTLVNSGGTEILNTMTSGGVLLNGLSTNTLGPREGGVGVSRAELSEAGFGAAGVGGVGAAGGGKLALWIHKQLTTILLGMLPGKELSEKLVEAYFNRRYNPSLFIYPESCFRKTHGDMWKIIERHRRAVSPVGRGAKEEDDEEMDVGEEGEEEGGEVEPIDPLWLAGYFECLALVSFTSDGKSASGLVGVATRHIGSDETEEKGRPSGDGGEGGGERKEVYPGVTKEDLSLLAKTWLEAAQLAMLVGEWSMKPRIRSLQAILMMFPTLQFMSSNKGEAMDRYLVWLAGAVRIATLLGLHQLGPDEENRMPPDDPAWPPGENCIKREVGKRIWHGLCFADAMVGSYIPSRVGSIIQPGSWDTPLPANVNENDLGLHARVKPRPLEELTDMSLDLFKYRLGMQQRQTNDATLPGKHPTYQQILDLDAGFRSIVDHIPLVFRPSAATSDESPLLTQRRAAMEQSLCFRLLRLHRRYVHRGLRDPRYRKSVDTCQWAAKRILDTHAWPTPSKPFVHYFALLHLLNAVSILAVIAFSHVDRWGDANAESVCESIVHDMDNVASNFRPYAEEMHHTIYQAAEQTEMIIQRLTSEIRGSMDRAREASRVGGPKASTETLSTVVRRMAESFADDPSGSRTSSSPRDASISHTPGSTNHSLTHQSSPAGNTHVTSANPTTAGSSSASGPTSKNPRWFSIGPEMTSPMQEDAPSQLSAPQTSGGGFGGFDKPEDIAHFLSTFAYGNPVDPASAAIQNPMAVVAGMTGGAGGNTGAHHAGSGAASGSTATGALASAGNTADGVSGATAPAVGLDWTSMFTPNGEWPSWESMAF